MNFSEPKQELNLNMKGENRNHRLIFLKKSTSKHIVMKLYNLNTKVKT